MSIEKTKLLKTKKSSFKTKLLFFPILILFLAILIISVASSLAFKKNLYQTIEDNGFLVAKTLARMLDDDKANTSQFQLSVEQIVEDGSIEYATIIDQNYEVIAHSNFNLIGTTIENYATKIAAIDGQPFSNISYYELTESECLHIMYPLIVSGKHIGAIVLGFELTNANELLVSNIKNTVYIGLSLLFILSVIQYYLSNGIINSINKLKELINHIAQGNLNVEVPTNIIKHKDELGEMAQSVLDMKQSLTNIIYTIAGKSEQLSATAEELSAITKQSSIVSNEIANAVSQISEGAMVQSDKTLQGRQSINELAGLIDNNKIYVDELNSSATRINNLIDDGYHIVEELISYTENNTSAAKEITEIISNTNESAIEVSNTSDMIKNIAAQTNLLALNATIEAARAGEAGKGFAVVASEIRKLADETSILSEQISAVINNLIENTNYTVDTMSKVARIVTSQSNCVEHTNETFKNIATSIEGLNSLGSRINTSSNNMNEKKELIYNIIDDLSSISEENAASTEETTASVEEQTSSLDEISQASEELAIISEELNKIIHTFNIQ